MAKTNWQDPGTSEIISPHISGLQDAVKKIEEAIDISTVSETDISLSEVYISEEVRYRIYQAPVGKRNWLLSPAPVIKKNGVEITTGFEIEYGGGAIIFNPTILDTDVITADVTYTLNETKPEYQTISLSDRIHHIANTVKGQVSDCKIYGKTLSQEIKNGNFNSDIDNWNILYATHSLNNGILSVIANQGEEVVKVYTPYINKIGNKYFTYAKVRPNTVCDLYIEAFLSGYPRYTSKINAEANVWHELYGTLQQTFDDRTSTHLRIGAENATDITMDVDGNSGIFLINMTQLGIEDYTEEQMLEICRGGYWEGVNSTVLAQRLLSHGKNMFDKSKAEIGSINVNTGADVNSTEHTRSSYMSTHFGLTYFSSVDGLERAMQFVQYDRNRNFLRNTSGTSFTAISDGYVRVYNSITYTNLLNENYQLEEGTTATTYEKHQKSIYYIYAEDENGDIIEAHSLPNGVKDEVKDGILYKRTWKDGIQSSDVISIQNLTNVTIARVAKQTDSIGYGNLTNGWMTVEGYDEFTGSADSTDNIGKFKLNAENNNIYFIFTLGTTLTDAQNALAGTPYIYQLAEEKIYEIPNLSDIYSFDGETTIIIEPAIEFEAIADSSGQITIPDANLPIAFVESVKEKIIDGDNISYIDATYTEVDTSTIGSLTQGKKYKVVYHYDQELTTIPELEITYGMNTAATISGLVDIQRKLQDELGSVWITLLPLADKELAMYGIATIATDMSADANDDELKSKINEIINVWKG